MRILVHWEMEQQRCIYIYQGICMSIHVYRMCIGDYVILGVLLAKNEEKILLKFQPFSVGIIIHAAVCTC